MIAYWRDHYDVAERLRRHWPELKRDLDGKIHLTVGTADTFYLDGAAHRLEATMKALGARTDFRYVEGRGHFDLYTVGDDRWGLYKAIAWEMYALARPGSKSPTSAPLRRQRRPAEAGRVGQLGRGRPAAVISKRSTAMRRDATTTRTLDR